MAKTKLVKITVSLVLVTSFIIDEREENIFMKGIGEVSYLSVSKVN